MLGLKLIHVSKRGQRSKLEMVQLENWSEICDGVWKLTWFEHIQVWWHIYVSMNWVIIGSGNGLLPIQCQAIIWTNTGLLLTGPLEKLW